MLWCCTEYKYRRWLMADSGVVLGDTTLVSGNVMPGYSSLLQPKQYALNVPPADVSKSILQQFVVNIFHMASSSKVPKRQYDDSLLNSGFTAGNGWSQCIIYHVTLSEESMKPKKLKGNQETQHPDVFGKPRDFFLKKRDALEKKKHKRMSFLATGESAAKASYVHAHHFAKTMKQHIICEELLLPATMDILRFMFGVK